MKKPDFDIYLPFKLGFLVLGLIIILYAFLRWVGIRLSYPKVSKQHIADYYQVNRRTLTNWFNCFLEEDLINKVNNQRKIPLEIAFEVYKQLGTPEDFPVLNRSTIIEIGEGTYNQLVITINRVAEDYNLSKEKLTKIRKFPPTYGKIIADAFGIHPDEIEDYLSKP